MTSTGDVVDMMLLKRRKLMGLFVSLFPHDGALLRQILNVDLNPPSHQPAWGKKTYVPCLEELML